MKINLEETQYLNCLKDIIQNGTESKDRTGVGTKFLFSKKFDYDISNGKIPIWTTRKIPWKNQVWELIWFIRGDTNIRFLKDNGVNIWDSWTDEQGSVGPIYGQQLRRWHTVKWTTPECEYSGDHNHVVVDQLQNLINNIKNNPESRRHIIALWNPGMHNDLENPYLPPCHSQHIQIVIEKNKYLNYQMIQRSADMPLGYCPWQHALFANIIAKLTGYETKQMSVIVTNAHVYENQFETVKEQIKRIPTEFPTLKMNDNIKTIEDVENSVLEDYELINYNPQSYLKYPIAI